MKNELNGKTNHVICFTKNIIAWKCMYLDHVHVLPATSHVVGKEVIILRNLERQAIE